MSNIFSDPKKIASLVGAMLIVILVMPAFMNLIEPWLHDRIDTHYPNAGGLVYFFVEVGSYVLAFGSLWHVLHIALAAGTASIMGFAMRFFD